LIGAEPLDGGHPGQLAGVVFDHGLPTFEDDPLVVDEDVIDAEVIADEFLVMASALVGVAAADYSGHFGENFE